MKTPPKPPNHLKIWQEIVSDKDKLAAIGSLVRLNNAPYDHWDKARFREPIKPFSAQEMWTLTKLNRKYAQKPLPFDDKIGGTFTYVPSGSFQRALHEIDSYSRGLFGMPGGAATSEGRDVYLQKSLIEEPFSSSALEGAATTREIARKMIEDARPPKTLDEHMVLNNYEAMNFVREHRNDPLTPAMIFEIHRILTKDTLQRPEKVGVFRAGDDDVRVVDANTDETLHQPPKASELPVRLERLCAFANSSSDEEFLHPVIRAIILHFMLAYDHPFWDGNGRCARALFYWCVLKHGYWLLEYVSISSVIRRAPVKYGTAFLYTETDEGDVTYFIDHQLEVIEKSIADLQEYLVKKTKELRDLGTTLGILESQLNRRQLQLIQQALRQPSIRYVIADHAQLQRVSYLTARSDLEALAKMGLLKKTKDGVKSVFLVPVNLRERLDKQAAV